MILKCICNWAFHCCPQSLNTKKLLGRLKWLTVADKIRNFCVTSQLENSKQIEEILALAS